MSIGKTENLIEESISTHIDLLRDFIPSEDLRSIYDFGVYTRLVVDDLVRFVEVARPSGRVLDFGCGRGTMSYTISQLGYDVVGIDVNLADIDISRTSYVLKEDLQAKVWAKTKKMRKNGLEFSFYDGFKLPFDDNKFDVVVAYAVLEHVEDLELSLSEIARVLKKDGMLFVSRTPIKYSYVEKFADVAGIPAHDNRYKRSEIIGFMKKAGFEIEEIERIDFFPSCMPFSDQVDAAYQRFDKFLFKVDKIIRKTPLSWISHHFRIVARKC